MKNMGNNQYLNIENLMRVRFEYTMRKTLI